MAEFNPNDIGVPNGNFFGLPYSVEESKIVLLMAPWDVTTSYMAGTSDSPNAILNASVQVDLFDENIPNAWEAKIGTLPQDESLYSFGKRNREIAERVIESLSTGLSGSETQRLIDEVNEACSCFNNTVYNVCREQLEAGRFVGIVGGEHSVPLGLVMALGERHEEFGVLHIDAHADLRRAYEGFTYSHASIMYNILNRVPQVKRLVQVAVRDFCSDEYAIMQNDSRVVSFTDSAINRRIYDGGNWREICDEIVERLPNKVYISFDIDGLEPSLCANTGTPVPGGLGYRQAVYLLERVVERGKEIIGFDLCEVAGTPDTEAVDANVGARVLYKLSLLLWKSINKF